MMSSLFLLPDLTCVHRLNPVTYCTVPHVGQAKSIRLKAEEVRVTYFLSVWKKTITSKSCVTLAHSFITERN